MSSFHNLVYRKPAFDVYCMYVFEGGGGCCTPFPPTHPCSQLIFNSSKDNLWLGFKPDPDPVIRVWIRESGSVRKVPDLEN
jgi:hypothetical protein